MSIETTDIPGLRGERNTAGCYRVSLVDAEDVDTVPDEVQGNVPGDVVLYGGMVFTVVKASTFEMLFTEESTYENGSPRVDALLEWPIPKDRLSLLPILHGFHRMRVVAVVETLNPDPDDVQDLTRLIIGNKEEPAMAFLVKRKTGADPRSDRSDYTLQVRWTRSTPTPFYNGTAPDLLPIGECPTIEQLLDPLSGEEVFALLDYTQQMEALNAPTMAFLWLLLTPTHKTQLLTAAGAVIIADIDGGILWGMLSGTQQTALLAAAGIVTVTRINNSGPPYTDVIIDIT